VLYCPKSPLQLNHVFCMFSQTARFSREKKWYRTQNVRFDFLYNFCPKHFSLYEEFSARLSKMYTGLQVMCPLFLLLFKQIWIFSTIFEKILKYISQKTVQSGPSYSVRTNGRTDKMKVKLAFQNLAAAPFQCSSSSTSTLIPLWYSYQKQPYSRTS
jgi:hypothetical protein